MSRILVVTPYPPQPDGIAAYASQTVRRLRAAGDDVEVLSPGPSAAHHHLDLRGPRGALALARRVRAYDEVTIQFHPDFFYEQPATTDTIARESLALLSVATAAHHLEVRVHEIDHSWGTRRDFAGWATRRFWRAVSQISVHTESERADFIEAFRVDPARVRVVEHGLDFTAHTRLDRKDARASLGIAPDATCMLAIGFIQRHKGYDRAVAAFREISAPRDARLDIVGSVRVEDGDNARYLAQLRELVDTVPGAHLHTGFITDEAFDRWIVACDAVVLPYRAIWSSGVLERALLLDRPVIVSDVGALRQQAADRAGVTIVADDDELRAAMDAVVHPGAPRSLAATVGAWPATPLTAPEAQRVINERATRRRGRPVPPPSTAHAALHQGGGEVPLREMHGIGLPEIHGNGPLARRVKRIVRRLTAWEIDPIIHHVNALHAATVDAISPSEPPPADESSDAAHPADAAETRR